MFRMFHVKHFQDFGMLKTGYLKKRSVIIEKYFVFRANARETKQHLV